MTRSRSTGLGGVLGYVVAVVLVAAAVALGTVLERTVGLREPALIFLSAVLVTAVAGGLWPSIAASVLGVLAYNFYFTEPYYTFNVANPHDIVALIVFLAVAALTSHLVARVRADAIAASAREARTATLYALSRAAAAASSVEDLLPAIAQQAGEHFHAAAVVSLPSDGALAPRASYPAGTELPAQERAAAEWAWTEGRTASIAAESAASGSGWLHASLAARRGQVAVLSLALPPGKELDADEQRLLDALAQQAAVALERCLLDRGSAEAVKSAASPDSSGALFGKTLASLVESRGGRIEVEERADRTSFKVELPRH
jgi:two-component system sensor histidine kinase KdpD